MANKYYQIHNERLQKEAHERYQSPSEEEKDKRLQKVRKIYQNVPVKEKQKLLDYMKNNYWAHKKVSVKSLKKILLIFRQFLLHALVLKIFKIF